MNSHDKLDDCRQLDRLVDAELTGDEYRELLARLDREPGGWRRCAMAFLEAQAWKQDFGQLPAEMLSGRDDVAHPFVAHGERHGAAWQVSGLILAMVASFAVAFVSGVWWQAGTSPEPDPSRSQVVGQFEARRSPESGEQPRRGQDDKPTSDGNSTEHLTFVVNRGDGESDRFELPIYEANDRFARQLLQGSPAMPADVEQAIRNLGYQIRRERQWARVQLRDGRRARFPVDQLEITPVSGISFQ